jgi:3-hydroxybutyryl-CoA dehydratase
MTTGETLEGFGVGQQIAVDFCVTEDMQESFALLSGDRNPVHLDAEFAAAKGFAAPVVYGGLLIAQLSRAVGMSFPGALGLWSSVQMDFRSPLLVGEQARLTAEIFQISEATRSLVLKVAVRCGDKLVASGRAIGTLHRKP